MGQANGLNSPVITKLDDIDTQMLCIKFFSRQKGMWNLKCQQGQGQGQGQEKKEARSYKL